MKVQIKLKMEQVRDGSDYKGHVEIAGVKFDYELKFAIPIPELEKTEPSGVEEVRRLIQIYVKKRETSIELTNDEYGFFLPMLLEPVVDFYHNQMTRAHQEGIVGQVLRGQIDFGVSMSIGLESDFSMNVPDALCKTLNSPKFGCVLV